MSPIIELPDGTRAIVERGPGASATTPPLLPAERERCEDIKPLYGKPVCEIGPIDRADCGWLVNCERCPYRGET